MVFTSRIIGKRSELADLLKTEDGIFVLFYASWCPFSLQFLSIYEKHAGGRERRFFRMTLDGNEDVFQEYDIEVYPTVIFFRSGKIHRRIDGKYLQGLKESELTELIASCQTDAD